MRKAIAVAAAALVLLGPACDSAETSSGDDIVATSPEKLSVAYKLAVIDGDPSEEPAFQAAIECIMASGIEGAETEEKIGDTLVPSWEKSGKGTTLLEWAQLLCSG
jgi:hypothetical protein